MSQARRACRLALEVVITGGISTSNKNATRVVLLALLLVVARAFRATGRSSFGWFLLGVGLLVESLLLVTSALLLARSCGVVASCY